MPQFGRPERQKFVREQIALHEAREPVDTRHAWKLVYRLLAWLDDHNGLLHIYDSHKVRARSDLWFTRSRVATEALCEELGLSYEELAHQIDLLFKRFLETCEEAEPLPPPSEDERRTLEKLFSRLATPDLLPRFKSLAAVLDAILPKELGSGGLGEKLAYAAVTYFRSQRARQNMTGEGFEDVIGLLIEKLAPPAQGRILIGQDLERVEGFGARPPDWPQGRHIPRPDIAISNSQARSVFIITLKWSLRHDREGTFREELEAYTRFLNPGWHFDFYALTNDFDLGRINRLVQFEHSGGRPQFSAVAHVALDLLLRVHRATPRGVGSLSAIEERLDEGRLISLAVLFERIQEHNARR